MTQSSAPPSRKPESIRLDRLLRTTLAGASAPLGAAGCLVEHAATGDSSATGNLYLFGPARPEVRILLVFESSELATATRRMLQRQLPAAAIFRVAATIDDALSELRARRFDVVLADFTGPAPQASVALLVAAAAHYSNAPILALGTETDPAAAAEICILGAQDYLVRDETSDVTLARAVLCARARSERTRKLLDVAHADELTGVANRRPLQGRFLERRHDAIRHGGGIAMLVADVDRFKEINDAHGHFAGDRVLVTIASRIVSNVRTGDLVARLGGDEFAVMLGRIGESALEELSARLEAALSRPVQVGDESISVSVSVGHAFGNPDETTELSMLARRADAEMYRRKRDRRRG